MEIYESIKGEISVPVFRDNAYTGNTVIAFGEDAIVPSSGKAVKETALKSGRASLPCCSSSCICPMRMSTHTVCTGHGSESGLRITALHGRTEESTG